jgi:large conductance mechanosensitive channel
VSSLVADVIMPPIGMVVGKVDFSNMFVSLDGKHYDSLKAAKDAGAATLNYGVFLNNVIDFVIVAFCVFLIVKQINRLRTPPPPAEKTTKECPQCLMEIPIKALKCGHCTSNL